MKKETGKGRCRVLTKIKNHAIYTDVLKEFALNGSQRRKFRKAEGRSGEAKEIHDLIRELGCQRKKRTAGTTDDRYK
jgi:hypothetical protein